MPRREPLPKPVDLSELHRAKLSAGLALAERLADRVMEDLLLSNSDNFSLDDARFQLYQFMLTGPGGRDESDPAEGHGAEIDAAYLMGVAIGRRTVGVRHAA